ncbi:MAG: GFA family protein, partial [Gammaproteobacteria bacterium]|nr:GFA family protein [Gammaproteobacteria bacterium]
PTCGSSLWMTFFDWEWIFVKTANLDNPEEFAPTTHFGVESQLPWHDVHDDLPRLRCEDSRELAELWDSAGVHVSDAPRNVQVTRKI